MIALLDTVYSPRSLTRGELKKLDIYAYRSPKLRRDVYVAKALVFALALQFEFDPGVELFCERPRTLPLRDGALELHYWTRLHSGQETHWLFVPAEEAMPARSGRVRYRQHAAAVEAAQRAQFALAFAFESELLAQRVAIANRYALLPLVQTAHAMDNFEAVRQRVTEQFRFVPSATFTQMEQTLAPLNPHDVRAVLCAAVHVGELTLDWSQPLHIHTRLNRNDRHVPR